MASFVFVIILFFFSHWRSYKILVQNNHERNSELVQDTRKQVNERSSEETERDELKCRSQNGLQTSAHCVNKGDDKNILVYFKYDDA